MPRHTRTQAARRKKARQSERTNALFVRLERELHAGRSDEVVETEAATNLGSHEVEVPLEPAEKLKHRLRRQQTAKKKAERQQ